MVIVLGISVGLILAGLLMVYLCRKEAGILFQVVYWVGVVLIAIGLVLLLAPVFTWLSVQFRQMLDLH